MEESKQQPGSAYYQPQGPAPPPGYYGQPQQQQPYVVVQQPAVVVVGTPPGKSYAAHMALACCACWCCGGLWGLIAFIVALIAHRTSGRDPKTANILGSVSICLSVVGIICGIIILIVYVVKVYLVIDSALSVNGTYIWNVDFQNQLRNDTAARNASRTLRDAELMIN